MKRLSMLCALLLVLPWMALAQLNDTGQTKCYDGTQDKKITYPSPGQPFYGQDAQYITTPQSYTKLDKNGNCLPLSATAWVMVRDNVTGLIWEVKQDKDDRQNYANPHDADNTYTWYDGDKGTPGSGTDTFDFINALNAEQFGGYSDWRLPTVKELSFIRNMETYNPAIDTDYFPNTLSSYYWSSTSVIGYPDYAWYVHFHYGIFNGYKSYYYYVRAVRGGK